MCAAGRHAESSLKRKQPMPYTIKFPIITLFTLLLAACSGGAGPSYSSMPPLKLEKGMAQLVIYHPSGEFTGSIGVGSGPNIKINGKVVCSLPNSSFFITDVSPGEVHISSTKLLSVGTSFLDLNTQPNKRYYVRITWNGTKLVAGQIGEVLTQGESYRNGPFIIEHVDEQPAKEELQSLNMNNCN